MAHSVDTGGRKGKYLLFKILIINTRDSKNILSDGEKTGG